MQQRFLWGWDPKEDHRRHNGYQGTHVGYPFEAEGSKCIVWVTGEEAFLECVSEHTRKRTSAGLWGYGHWKVLGLSDSC